MTNEVKEYIVYRLPDGSVLVDWNGNTWKYGYPYYPKSKCTELEIGCCKGGSNLLILQRKMKEKYCNTAKTPTATEKGDINE